MNTLANPIIYRKSWVYRDTHYFSQLDEAVLTSTHNLCLDKKIKENIFTNHSINASLDLRSVALFDVDKLM